MKLLKMNPRPQEPLHRRRTILAYAYFPTKLDNGDVIWFEEYLLDQHFRFFKRKWMTFGKRQNRKMKRAREQGRQYSIAYVNKDGQIVG